MADLLSVRAADNIRLARSGSIITPAAATYNLIRIPKFAFITDLWLLVTTAGSSDTVDVGFIGNGETADPNYFLDATYSLVTGTGVVRASQDSVSLFAGKWFSAASGLITMTVGTTQSTGNFTVFVQYAVIH